MAQISYIVSLFVTSNTRKELKPGTQPVANGSICAGFNFRVTIRAYTLHSL